MRRALLIVSIAALVAACSGDGVEQAGGGAGSGEGGLRGLLALLPDAEGASDFVVVNDMAAAAEAAGIEAPSSDADEDDITHYFVELTSDPETGLGVSPNQFTTGSANEADAWREEFGFSPADITGDATAGAAPELYQAYVGDFDPDAVQAAVESDEVWSESLEQVDHAGSTYYSWGEDDGIDPERITPVRRLGESLRLFVNEDLAYVARSTAAMEADLDAATGEAPTLLDHDPFGAMVDALDDADAYSALLTDDVAQFQAGGQSGPTLQPFEAMATGAALVDGQAQLVIVLANEDDAAAEQNAEQLADVVADGTSAVNNTAWADVLGEGTITTDGTLTIGVFPSERARLWYDMVLTRDSLLSTG